MSGIFVISAMPINLESKLSRTKRQRQAYQLAIATISSGNLLPCCGNQVCLAYDLRSNQPVLNLQWDTANHVEARKLIVDKPTIRSTLRYLDMVQRQISFQSKRGLQGRVPRTHDANEPVLVKISGADRLRVIQPHANGQIDIIMDQRIDCIARLEINDAQFDI